MRETNSESIISRKDLDRAEEKRRKKSFLCKITKFTLQNGMRDDLEKRYEEFINDCSAFPRVRFEMVDFILEKYNIENI